MEFVVQATYQLCLFLSKTELAKLLDALHEAVYGLPESSESSAILSSFMHEISEQSGH